MKRFRLLLLLGSLLVVSNLAVLAIYLSTQPDPTPITPSDPTVVPIEQPEISGGKSPIREEPVVVAPTFITIEKVRSLPENSVYGDVISHSRETPYGNAYGRATNVHETTHGINSWIRNQNSSGKRANGFYVLQDRAVLVDEMRFRKSQVAKFVPQNLRSVRFSTYITGQTAWDDTPTYILDEWVCYVNGAKCNVEDVQNGRYQGEWTDGVSGSLEFSVYAIALAMAVKEHEPQSWNPQFRSFLIWGLQEAEKTFMVGRAMDKFKWDKQDVLLREFLTSSTAEPMRKFVRENLDGVWLSADAEALKAVHYEPYQRYPVSKEVEKRVKLPEPIR